MGVSPSQVSNPVGGKVQHQLTNLVTGGVRHVLDRSLATISTGPRALVGPSEKHPQSENELKRSSKTSGRRCMHEKPGMVSKCFAPDQLVFSSFPTPPLQLSGVFSWYGVDNLGVLQRPK